MPLPRLFWELRSPSTLPLRPFGSIPASAAPGTTIGVFDWTVSSPNAGGCIFGKGPISGIMYYDAASRQIRGFANFRGRSDLWDLIGTK